jgi:hypothetical protein
MRLQKARGIVARRVKQEVLGASRSAHQGGPHVVGWRKSSRRRRVPDEGHVSKEVRCNAGQCHKKSRFRAMNFNNRQGAGRPAGPLGTWHDCEKRKSNPPFIVSSQSWAGRIGIRLRLHGGNQAVGHSVGASWARFESACGGPGVHRPHKREPLGE